jgi:thymidylate synthase
VTFILYDKGGNLNGNIPVLFVEGDNLPEAWEKSLVALNEYGCSIRTQYDNLEGPASKDCSMSIVVNDPLSEPMIPTGIILEDLMEYVLEMVDGIKGPLIPEKSAWREEPQCGDTIHQRLYKYTVPGLDIKYDQIKNLTQKLIEMPHTRQAQAITWKVWEDNAIVTPACLQSIWCRLLMGDDKIWYLNSNVRFRSNDAYKVAYLDMFAIIQILKGIARDIATVTGYQVRLGRYVHQADSYHIYGSDLKDFNDKFLRDLRLITFEKIRSLHEYGNNNG